MVNFLDMYMQAIGISIQKVVSDITDLLGELQFHHEIRWRIKTEQKISAKMHNKFLDDPTKITDIYGLRILVREVKHIYEIIDKLKQKYQIYIDYDYVQTPKTSPELPGAQLRLVQIKVAVNAVFFEIQITTFEFNEENETLHNGYNKRKYS